ncbi:TonB-dependent hemoglobin/transferrin/lactoferrin family receptor [Polynucleobacter sp. 30F-ANTBAC]|uniref:TonB-dependent hemoglobin/transferrin/lactoferrin family receptor n=1 Tax=Polynucleobacter sp. 30F-ANTBAC TaxID=2689095 RepID=UPI001C0BC383|nr:TonB-dependent hemoglobin/transferrin/lactoferrin family receptor [Polynucleobacter sp. 30F-ANTBAC]
MIHQTSPHSAIKLLASLLIAPSVTAYASNRDYASITHLEPIAVIATKGERHILETPSSVSVFDYEDIKRKNSKDIKDLFEEELDVEVRSQGARFGIAAGTGRSGQESINIRGLEGNQVLLMVDGIPVAQAFNYGAASTGRVDYLEMEGISLVEVLRGPTATQYGSDGLAGAIHFQTLTMDDVLQAGNNKGGYIKGVGRTVNQSSMGAIALAERGNEWDVMLLSSNAYGSELKNQGSNGSLNDLRTVSNPEKNQQNYLLAKLRRKFSTSQSILVTVEDLDKQRDTELYSGRSAKVFDLDAQDRIQRQRFSIDFNSKNPILGFEDELNIKLWMQQSQVHQLTIEDRLVDRQRNNQTKDQSTGLKTQLTHYIEGVSSQKWTYGFDIQRSEVKQSVQRSGDYSDQIKYHPDSIKEQAGLFTQLELDGLAYGFIPALRFDKYAYQSEQFGYSLPTVNLTDSAWSPSLAAIWKYQPFAHPYINLAKGFKAPTQDQINNGFSNLRHGYTSKGNPDLKSETSQGIEIGLKGKVGAWRYQAAAYRNEYKDFIEHQVIGGTGRRGDPLIYQYVNHTQAQIQGMDLRMEGAIDSNWRLTSGWVTSTGYKQSAKGVQSELDTIQPMRAALGLIYQTAHWQNSLHWSHTWAKKDKDVGTVTDIKTRNQVSQYVAPSYSVINLQSQWKPISQLTILAGINNLFDKKYWRWSDVRGLEAASPVIDAYSAPGRNISLGARYDF